MVRVSSQDARFEAALEAEAPWVRRLAQALARDVHSAEDLAQKTLLAALERRPGAHISLRGWLTVTLRHVWLRGRRDEARRHEREDAWSSDAQRPSEQELLARAALHRDLMEAVLGLPDPYRTAILLRYLDEIPPREIAARQGVPVRTIATRLQRGLQLLRARLKIVDLPARRAWLAALLPWIENATQFAAPGILMSATTKVAGAGLLAAVLAAIAWWASAGSSEANKSPEGAPPSAGAGAASAPASVQGPGTAARTSGVGGQSPQNAQDAGAALRGRVVDELGTGIPGARVALLHSEGSYSMLRGISRVEDRAAAETTAGADGTFRIAAPESEPHDLEARAPGFAASRVYSQYVGIDVELRLVRAARLEVRLLEEPTRAPVAGAPVRLISRAPTSMIRGSRMLGVSDESGRLVFEDVAPGRYDFWVESSRHEHTVGNLLDLAPGESKSAEMLLRPGSALRGTVTSASTGAPIVGAEVSASWTFTSAVRTGAAGEFEMRNLSKRMARVLHVRAAGHAGAVVDLGAFKPEGATVQIQLPVPRIASGKLVDASGAPIEGALVMAVSEKPISGDVDNHTSRSGADGKFVFDQLRRDLSHTLLVHAAGHAGILRPFPDSELSTDRLDLGEIRLAAPASLQGIVRTPQGEPIAGAAIFVLPIVKESTRDLSLPGFDPREIAVYSDSRGRYFLSGLAAGAYSIRGVPPGVLEDAVTTNMSTEAPGPVARLSVELAEGERRGGLDLTIELGEVICGKVIGEDGRALAGATVEADPEVSPGRRGLSATGADGYFQIGRLGRGKYRLRVSTFLSWVEDRSRNQFERASPETVVHDIESGNRAVIIRVPRAQFISGSVVSADGTPAANAGITISDRPLLAPTVADADGRFRIAVPPGEPLTLQFLGPAGESATIAAITPGTSDLRVTLKK